MNISTSYIYMDVELCAEKLMGRALKLTKNKQDAQDLVQDTFLRMYTKIHQFEEGTNFIAWGQMILGRLFVDKYRRGQRNILTEAKPLEEDWQGGQEDFLMMDYHTIKEIYFSQLTDLEKCIVELRMDGLSYKEISERLDINMNTLKGKFHQMRKRLLCLSI